MADTPDGTEMVLLVTTFFEGCGMAAKKQELLKELWWGGKPGTMSAQTEARAWALREAWQDEHGDKTYGMLPWIASKVWKIKEEKKKKEHPSPSALSQLFEKIDNDEEWFPGKCDREKYGPAPVINGSNQAIIARSAMIMKEKGEPSYPQLVAANPKATLNPKAERCYGAHCLRKRWRKLPPEPSKTQPGGTQTAPKSTREAPMRAQMRPRAPKRRPKGAQERPRDAQERAKPA